MNTTCQSGHASGSVKPGSGGRSCGKAETRRLLRFLREQMPVRMDKVLRARRLIALGQLDTPERIEQAVQCLVEELA